MLLLLLCHDYNWVLVSSFFLIVCCCSLVQQKGVTVWNTIRTIVTHCLRLLLIPTYLPTHNATSSSSMFLTAGRPVSQDRQYENAYLKFQQCGAWDCITLHTVAEQRDEHRSRKTVCRLLYYYVRFMRSNVFLYLDGGKTDNAMLNRINTLIVLHLFYSSSSCLPRLPLPLPLVTNHLYIIIIVVE